MRGKEEAGVGALSREVDIVGREVGALGETIGDSMGKTMMGESEAGGVAIGRMGQPEAALVGACGRRDGMKVGDSETMSVQVAQLVDVILPRSFLPSLKWASGTEVRCPPRVPVFERTVNSSASF